MDFGGWKTVEEDREQRGELHLAAAVLGSSYENRGRIDEGGEGAARIEGRLKGVGFGCSGHGAERWL
jgi:hypothetical protein